MAKYAKDQPTGFNNRVERVAIVGAGGQVGRPIVEALLKTGKHTVTAITRKDSQNKLPKGVKVAEVNYDDESTVVDALRGQQFLIISMNVHAAPDSQDKILVAAAKAGVPWVMPNNYGADFRNESLARDIISPQRVQAAVKTAEEAGLSWVALCCSFWYEYSLALEPGYGFDLKNKKVVLYDDGKTAINTSTWQQCGRAVANFLSLKELPEDENDKEPSISQWRNRMLFMSSFLVSQRDMLDSLHRVMGTSDADWEITKEPCEERFERGKKIWQGGDRTGFAMLMYTRMFYPNGDGNFEAKHGLANDVLGLPKEDMDRATRRAVEMAVSDWKPSDRGYDNIYD